jgi:hypothetical protein
VQLDLRPPKPAPSSTLSQLANGPYRLWMFGAGIMFVFMGLLLAPGHPRRQAAVEEGVCDRQGLESGDRMIETAERSVDSVQESIETYVMNAASDQIDPIAARRD